MVSSAHIRRPQSTITQHHLHGSVSRAALKFGSYASCVTDGDPCMQVVPPRASFRAPRASSSTDLIDSLSILETPPRLDQSIVSNPVPFVPSTSVSEGSLSDRSFHGLLSLTNARPVAQSSPRYYTPCLFSLYAAVACLPLSFDKQRYTTLLSGCYHTSLYYIVVSGLTAAACLRPST